MKTGVLLILISLNISLAQSFDQYFDGKDTLSNSSISILIEPKSKNIWQVGKPKKKYFNRAATEGQALITDTINYYPPNNISSFLIKILPWRDHGLFALQWVQKIDFEKNTDGGTIEYSLDKGKTWSNVVNNPHVYKFYGYDSKTIDKINSTILGFTGTDTTWKDIWLCFEFSFLEQHKDTIYFKFTSRSGSTSTAREGWLIDNVKAHVTYIHPISEPVKSAYINVYPNPTKEILHIDTQKMHEFHIIKEMQLIDTKGSIIDTWTNIPIKYFINTRKYTSGIYQLKIQTNLKTEIFSIIINNE